MELQSFCCLRGDLLYAKNCGLHKVIWFAEFLATSIAAFNAFLTLLPTSMLKRLIFKYRPASPVRAFQRALSKWSIGASLAKKSYRSVCLQSGKCKVSACCLIQYCFCCLRHDRFAARTCCLHALKGLLLCTSIPAFNALSLYDTFRPVFIRLSGL